MEYTRSYCKLLLDAEGSSGKALKCHSWTSGRLICYFALGNLDVRVCLPSTDRSEIWMKGFTGYYWNTAVWPKELILVLSSVCSREGSDLPRGGMRPVCLEVSSEKFKVNSGQGWRSTNTDPSNERPIEQRGSNASVPLILPSVTFFFRFRV